MSCCNSWRLWSRHSPNCPGRHTPQSMPDRGHVEMNFPASETTADPKKPKRHAPWIRNLPVRTWESPLDQFQIDETLINQDGTLKKGGGK